MSNLIDFTKTWPMADVELNLLNSDITLHVCKSFLAVYSPYFQVMFFGEFKEKDNKVIELQEDFNVMHMALKILHHSDGSNPSGPSKEYALSELRDLFNFADRCDVPFLREFCKAQLSEKEGKEALDLVVQLGLLDIKSKLLESLNRSALLDYLATCKSGPTFTATDVHVLVKKLGLVDCQLVFCDCRREGRHCLTKTGKCRLGRVHVSKLDFDIVE